VNRKSLGTTVLSNVGIISTYVFNLLSNVRIMSTYVFYLLSNVGIEMN
jgi:hypothetical protein